MTRLTFTCCGPPRSTSWKARGYIVYTTLDRHAAEPEDRPQLLHPEDELAVDPVLAEPRCGQRQGGLWEHGTTPADAVRAAITGA